jgi:hypothetical protein
VASDVVEVFAYVPFNIANALTVSTVDAKGDLLVGTAADTVGRLAVGTNGQLLSAASGETSGLKWANPGLTLLKTDSFTAVGSFTFPTNTFTTTYENYRCVINFTCTAAADLNLRMTLSGVDDTSSNYESQYVQGQSTTVSGARATATSGMIGYGGTADRNVATIEFYQPKLAVNTFMRGVNVPSDGSVNILWRDVVLRHKVGTAYDSATIIIGSGNMTGSYSIYGYNK